jgi:outer membrane receptor protein involved in Fe transport
MDGYAHSVMKPARLLLVCLLISFVQSVVGSIPVLASTGKIAGKVTDARSKEPLLGVNVVVTGTTYGAMTDLQGDYVIPNVPLGSYSLRASMLGYQSVTVTDIRVRTDVTTEVNVQLEETVLDIGKEVVIIAERPLVEKDNTSTRTIIQSDEILSRPTKELSGVMITLPSINLENGQMRIRGGGLNEVAFLIDGARARNPLDQSSYTSVNLGSIQEMEVITGSFNAEYGEARSGIVNIVTKEGAEQYHAYLDLQYTPAGKKHWGPALYDYTSNFYWENAHTRHLEWWIQNPDKWRDASGISGNDPRCSWTPEQAHQQYLATHQPLSDYTNIPSYQVEGTFGGPSGFIDGLNFFLSGKYRTLAPTFGNSYRQHGLFFDGTAKLTYRLSSSIKLVASGFLGMERTSWGILQPTDQPDYGYMDYYGYTARYAYYDAQGLPESQTDGITLKVNHVLSPLSMYELKLSRVHAYRKKDAFPNDPNGFWGKSEVSTYNVLHTGIDYEDNQFIGFETQGYLDRHRDNNVDWTFNGFYTNQLNKNIQLKSGLEFTYYDIDHFNQAKFFGTDSGRYHPYQGSAYAQGKFEFGGLIANAGLRYDFYNPNDVVYALFDPMSSPTQSTKTFSQLSPRVGISHPIDDKTVFHFSYGHFFQRATFGDYGENDNASRQLGSLATVYGTQSGELQVLGNRNTKPEKTVNFELGIERNFADVFVLNLTTYYKDVTNTVRGGITIWDQSTGLRYVTNGNADYQDVKGIEISLRKLPSDYIWGYANFTTQLSVNGVSGDPMSVTRLEDGTVVYGLSSATGDVVNHNRPRLKAGIVAKTPESDFLGGLFSDIVLSIDYQATFSNEKLGKSDLFVYSDSVVSGRRVRPPDQNTNLRITKGVKLPGRRMTASFYLEVRNLFNNRWINYFIFDRVSELDKRQYVLSNYEALPTHRLNGEPIHEQALYRNLPRAGLFGVALEF